MSLDNINNLMLTSIQIVGIFITIIGGLVASKLLSMKADKDETSDKIDILKKQVKHNQKILGDKIQENYRSYKEYEYKTVILACIDGADYNPYNYYDSYITTYMRRKFTASFH